MMDHPAHSIRAMSKEQRKFLEPDELGFIFLTNIKKGEQLPFDVARKAGYTTPEFDIRGSVLSPIAYETMPLQDKKAYTDEYEGVFVRETWRKPADFSDCQHPFF